MTALACAAGCFLAPSAGANHSQLELVSAGQSGQPANSSTSFAMASADGGKVFFPTHERILPEDTDNATDVYVRSGGVTSLVSTGATRNLYLDLSGISDDGAVVFLSTIERLSAADTDSSVDVYRSENGVHTLVSDGAAGGNGAFPAFFHLASADGSHVVFKTDEQLVPEDTDTTADVYDNSAGNTRLVSTGPAGGNSGDYVEPLAVSEDGTRIVFDTLERLTLDDTDSVDDIYVRDGGSTELVSKGPTGGNGAHHASFKGMTPDAVRVYFETDEALTADEPFRDCLNFSEIPSPCTDVYERHGTSTRSISGPGAGPGGDASFGGVTADGSSVYFETVEAQAPQDTDLCFQEGALEVGCPDVYRDTDGERVLMTPGGPDDCREFDIACDVTFRKATDSGSHVFFETPMSLVPEDEDAGSQCRSAPHLCADVYEHSASGTRILSRWGRRHRSQACSILGLIRRRRSRLLLNGNAPRPGRYGKQCRRHLRAARGHHHAALRRLGRLRQRRRIRDLPRCVRRRHASRVRDPWSARRLRPGWRQ